MSGSGSGPLVPTFTGFVQNSMDGLMLFEACLSGKLHHVPRRPHDRERSNLIKSGSIFIYEENASGIKRWTDGVAWSPSRILGNFLIYRELEKPFPPGEKKRAMKRKRSSQIDGEGGRRESEDHDVGEVSMPPTPPSPKPVQDQSGDPAAQDSERELDRQLIGSLVDSYGFRPDGLVKKTMSIAINGVSHHLVSYYKVEDVKKRTLPRPIEDARLAGLTVRPELYLKQNFRTPVEETEHYVVDPSTLHAHPGVHYPPHMMGGAYAMRPGQYMPPQAYGPMYNVPVSSGGMYSGTPAPGWASQQHPNLPPSYSAQSYAPQPQSSYPNYYERTSSSTPQSSMVKTEDANHASSSYSGQHFAGNPNPFSHNSATRPSSSSFSSMHSPYQQSPMRTPATSFPSSATTQHQNSTPTSATAPQYGSSGSPHSLYDPKPHTAQYTTQPGAPSYTSHSAAQHTSSHESLKSPVPGVPGSASSHSAMNPQMPYRQQSFQSREGASQSDVGALGMSTGYGAPSHSQPTQYHGGSYPGYGAATSGYRPAVDGNSAVSHPGQY
ncbi:hypothetical protein B9Z65_6241 [Elsinoe australis]|uniref:Global transcription regulator sge1 n=1 Tax=Elsinoe australis TaxID=40998 RepID=A0A2P8A829_9PEZI|nr:hypothetical protein B9Z65_6241 [Elsinoe australis]